MKFNYPGGVTIQLTAEQGAAVLEAWEGQSVMLDDERRLEGENEKGHQIFGYLVRVQGKTKTGGDLPYPFLLRSKTPELATEVIRLAIPADETDVGVILAQGQEVLDLFVARLAQRRKAGRA